MFFRFFLPLPLGNYIYSSGQNVWPLSFAQQIRPRFVPSRPLHSGRSSVPSPIHTHIRIHCLLSAALQLRLHSLQISVSFSLPPVSQARAHSIASDPNPISIPFHPIPSRLPHQTKGRSVPCINTSAASIQPPLSPHPAPRHPTASRRHQEKISSFVQAQFCTSYMRHRAPYGPPTASSQSSTPPHQ